MEEKKFIEIAQTLPQSPGVYIMKDASGKILYIGKAVNLRARVRSYFSDSHEDRPHIKIMLRNLDRIEWIATNNETEALILEANCIRNEKPQFNVLLKDDKHYPYLKLTVTETFPRLLIARKVEDDKSEYFGPYTDSRAAKKLLIFATKTFKIRDCSYRLPLKKPIRPCINYSIGRCSAPCAGKIGVEKYEENVKMLVQMLRGKRRILARQLEQKMKDASRQMLYEEAAIYRDQLLLITAASKLQQVDLKAPDLDCDVLGFAQAEHTAALAVLCFREGILISKRSYTFSRSSWDLTRANPDSLIVQLYYSSSQQIPDEIIVPENSGFNNSLLRQWFLSTFGKEIVISSSSKGQKARLIELAQKNAQLQLQRAFLAPQPADSEALNQIQRMLNLPRFPAIIEAFDVSNLGTGQPVASMVRFVNGVAEKSGYRRFSIKSVQGQNDFAMILEVVRRRLQRLFKEKKPFPDLLLIDGGKGQLSAAAKPLEMFDNPPMIAALAKKEELIFSQYIEEPLRLEKTLPPAKLLMAIRDEAHRFALRYHRALRDKQYHRSMLHNIAGIGPKKARQLINHFGSLKRIKDASQEDIAKLRGFTPELASRIKQTLQQLSELE